MLRRSFLAMSQITERPHALASHWPFIRIYQYDREKRQALDLWADRLKAIIGRRAAAVLPMRSRQ